MKIKGKKKAVFGACLVTAILVAAASFAKKEEPASSGDMTFVDKDGKIHANAKSIHPVVVNQPQGAPKVATGHFDFKGDPIEISCSVCHSTKEPNKARRSDDNLEAFHQGLTFKHGALSCLSCHNADNYDTLRLADGTEVAFENVMQLCSQCHGPQARDYNNGSHGGMRGFWDLSQGGRQRNNCVDCHDAHAPAYPQMMPDFHPRDRFPPAKGEHETH